MDKITQSESSPLESAPSPVPPTGDMALAPSPVPTGDMALRIQILALTEQLETLEGILKNESSLGIRGILNLRAPPLQHSLNSWEDRIYCLLYDCKIPHAWTYEVLPAECDDSEEDINVAYIYFINETTKLEGVKRIKRFLQINYTKDIEIL